MALQRRSLPADCLPLPDRHLLLDGWDWESSYRLGIRPWIAVAYSAPVGAATAVLLVYAIGQGSFSDPIPLGISGTFNCMRVHQAEHNVLIHPFQLFSLVGGFGGSLGVAMHRLNGHLLAEARNHGRAVPELCDNFSREHTNVSREQKTDNIVANPGFCGRLIIQNPCVDDSRTLQVVLAPGRW